jgi:cytochrome oxidase assembly protein ShyY1
MMRSKGFIAQLIAAIALSIIFIGLGNWQLDRSQDVKAARQFVPDSPRVDLESIASVTSNLEPSAINRLVKLSGNYREIFVAPNQELLTNGKKTFANLEVRLLELSGKRGILVVRGIESVENQEITGKVKISGRLYPRQTSDSAKALENEISRIDPLLQSLVALALVAACLFAAQWQFNRGSSQSATNKIIAANLDLPSLSMSDIRNLDPSAISGAK